MRPPQRRTYYLNHGLPEVVKKFVRERIRKDKSIGVLLKFDNGKIYWIPDHHKYLDFNLAQPVLLAKGKPPKGVTLAQTKYAYIIEELI